MRAGDLRHRGTIQEYKKTRVEGGGFETQWVDIAAVWFSLEPLSGEEQVIAQQLQATVTHRIRIRYRTGVKPYHRMKMGTRIFNFTSVVDPDERRRELEIMATEEVRE